MSTDGLTATLRDKRGNLTVTVKDKWGRVVSVTPKDASGQPVGPNVVYTYDEMDRLTMASRGGQDTILSYDYAGRKTSMSDPDMGYWTYSYDTLGNLTLQTDARGQRICLYYDSLNRLGYKQYRSDDNCQASPPPSPDVSYLYDAGTNGKGHRTSMTDASGSTSWTYDERGRMLSETKTITGGGSFVTEWDYNSADLPKWMLYPDGEEVTYEYNNRMLRDTLTGTGSFGTTGYVGGTTYDAAGRVTDRGLGNGLTQKFVYHPWDTQGGRLRLIAAGSGTWDSLGLTFATPLQRLDYSYDASGNITQIGNTEAAETQTYDYDALNRLTGWSLNGNISGIYEYGETNGNLEKKGTLDLQYNNTSHPHAVSEAVTLLDYICPVGAVCDHDQEVGGSVDNDYGYDANGNTLAPGASAGVISRPVNGQAYTLSYDAEGHLVSVSGGSYSAQFTYDGDGKRVKSVINGETILFIGSHYEVKIPASGNQEITKYYLAGNSRIALRKYVIPQSMEVEYLLGDHLGSTSLTTDAAGEKVSEMRYTPWGEVRYAWKDPGLDTTPAYTLTRWTFTGQYSYADDPSTAGVEDFGLMYFNARWVDPELSHFAQADSIAPGAGNPQAWDRYAFVDNNPVRFTDPSGHNPIPDFVTGFLSEFARTTAWFSPKHQEVLAVKADESAAMLTGRVMADIVSMAGGGVMIETGIVAGGSGAAACATGVGCVLGGAEAIAGGAALVGEGAGMGMRGAEGLMRIAAITSSNGSSDSYPNVNDPRTGDGIPEPPGGLEIVPKDQRAPWGKDERGAYIKEWYDKGYQTPEGGWAKYDLHHIIPREYGGSNDFWNIVPVERNIHQQRFNPWWNRYGQVQR